MVYYHIVWYIMVYHGMFWYIFSKQLGTTVLSEASEVDGDSYGQRHEKQLFAGLDGVPPPVTRPPTPLIVPLK